MIGHLPIQTPSVSISGELLPLDDVAARLALSVRTVRRLVARQHLGACKIGKAIRIPEEELSRFITERFRPPQAKEIPLPRLTTSGNVASIVDGIIDRHRRGAR